jgi:hypothetical protein
MHTDLWWGNLNVRGTLGKLTNMCGRILPKWVLKKQDGKAWDRFYCPRRETRAVTL